ncbi:MAG: caspase family protein [Phormidesmis sp.]
MSQVDFSRSIAIAIGIDRYSNGIAPLKTAVSDASAIAHLLKSKHGYSTHLLTDTQATVAHLNQLIHSTLSQHIQADDRLIFYFAGHGIALNGEGGPEGFLIPQDARLGDTHSYLSMVKLQQALIALPCRHFLAIFDCCFAGAFRWSSTRDISVVPTVIHQERYERFLLDPAWQVITSTAYDQTALDAFTFEDARGQQGEHSPFALALLEALAGGADASPPATAERPPGDGVITATELYLYLRDRIEAPTQQQGQRQTPGLFALGKHDKGEYIFLAPDHPLNLPPAPPLDPSQNPYRGLASFDEAQADLFFGRSDHIAQLQQQVTENTFTVVVGTSGSGKSSLVKAGLLPQLRSAPDWQIVTPLRPGNAPLKGLAVRIKEIRGERLTTTDQVDTLEVDTLANAVEQWSRAHPGKRLLLVIDQFEELLTLGESEEARSLFLEILARAVGAENKPTNLRQPGPSFHLILTLRADFEPQFRDSFLPDSWSTARFVLPPMTRADLREAIEQPANAKVMYFQSDDPRHPLVEQIINEVADMPGALPLLSFTLSELYLKFLERQQIAQQQGRALDRALLEADYKAMGGAVRSLTQRADQEYAALVQQDPHYAETVRHVMLRMIALGGGELTRRRVPVAELTYPGVENERAQTVIQRFSAARLLVEGQDLTGQPYVEPAHDALIRGWQRLLVWQREEENLALQRRLTPAALDWHREQKPRFLWNADPRLALLRQILHSPNNWLNRLETEFVERSLARKKRNGQLWAAGILSVIVLLSTGLLLALWGQRGRIIASSGAYRESARADLARNHTLEGLLSSLLAGQSLQHPLLRLIQPEEAQLNQVQGTLQWAMVNVREHNRLLGHVGPVRSQWSPDGSRIASAGEDGWLRLWNTDGEEIARWQADSQRLWLLRFSPDGQQIATAGEDGTVRLWSLTGEPLAKLAGHTGAVRYLSFSPNGQWLGSAGNEDGKVFLWNLQPGNAYPSAPFSSWQVNSQRVNSLYFHPQRPWLITTDEQRIQIWNYQGESLQQFDQQAWAAVFTPDGQKVVAAGDDGNVGVWDVASGDRLQLWQADDQRLWNLTLSPDGQQIATAGEDGIVKLWTLSGEPLDQFRNHTGPARSVSFSPDALWLASAGDDGSTRLWSVQTQELAQFLQVKDGGAVTTGRIQFVADGKQLVSGGSDGKLRFWNLAGQALTETAKRSAAIQDLDTDATGDLLAVLDASGSLSVRSLSQPQKAQRLRLSSSAADNIALSPDGKWLASTIQGKEILLLNRMNNQFQVLRAEGSSISRLTFSADGQSLASAGADGLIEVWDVRSGRSRQQLQEHIGQVHSIDFSPVNSRQLVSAGADGTIRLWDVELGKSVGSPFQVYAQEILSVAFSPDGLSLVSGDRTGSVQLWDIVNTEQIAAWQAHSSAVQDVRFSADAQQLVTASSDGSVKIWPIESFEQLMVRGCERANNFLQTQAELNPNQLCPDRDP